MKDGQARTRDKRAERIADFIAPLRVEPGSKVHLSKDFDPARTTGPKDRREGEEVLRTGVELLADYQRRLAADGSHGVLLCLQGLDAGGKDGMIRHVMSGVNPQGVRVAGFKVPSHEELAHDYLWRYTRELPRRGEIGIFNRSHYEEVLVVRVHPELLDRQGLPGPAKGPEKGSRKGSGKGSGKGAKKQGPQQGGKAFWRRRYREINDWERYLTDNGFRVVKLFLNLSKEEQRVRFLKRIDVPERNWKFSAADARERRRWDDYQRAFEEMLSATSTPWAPWYVVPADHKWYARICAAAVLAHTLWDIDPRYPDIGVESRRELQREKRTLEKEAPPGAPADPYAGKHGKGRAR
ncbi:polyphosphate kinase 2 family protein [Streptomyces sp. Q6]|uniref:Polyphosphate kinase 2 family protein n=1 Tax=Streptomyces citrinus TaxID=3118173 RepID=A0ACD5A6B5_9ACTN